MPLFTIESTYRLPVYRYRTYEAASLTEACRPAIEDDDWEKETRDYESAKLNAAAEKLKKQTAP